MVEKQFVGEKLDIYTIISQLIGSHKIIQTHYSKDVSTLNEGTYLYEQANRQKQKSLLK